MQRYAVKLNWSGLILIPLFIGLSSCFFQQSGDEYTSFGSVAATGKLEVRSANAYLRSNQPGIVFGLHRENDDPLQLSYLTIILHPEVRPGRFECKSRVGSDSRTAYESTLLRLDEINLDIMFEFNEAMKHLTINGKSYDTAKSTVFLIDIQDEAMNITEVDTQNHESIQTLIELFEEDQNISDNEAFKLACTDVIDSLSRDVAEVKQFLTD